MNMIKELESILKQPNFMGHSDNVGVNLAVNAILDKIEDLGFELVQKQECRDIDTNEEVSSKLLAFIRENSGYYDLNYSDVAGFIEDNQDELVRLLKYS